MPGRLRRGLGKRVGGRQRVFAFRERIDRLERGFRAAISCITILIIGAGLSLTSNGRYLARRAWIGSRDAARSLIGLKPSRDEIESDVRLRRERDVERTTRAFRRIYAQAPPPMKKLLDFAGLTPERAVLRWGNFDKILLLPGAVFAPDDSGRSYRMRPGIRSVWLRNVALPEGLDGFFLVPDRPETREIAAAAGAVVVGGSEQTTNSWGCRGPEFDPSAPLRGLILGDSNMQGLFVADDETPPARLKAELERRLGTKVSLLNTGHLGYSPEQFYASLVEYGERVRPQFVLLTLCLNDFGDVGAVWSGKADLEESKYWMDRIYDYCRVREILCVTSPVPVDHQVIATRRDEFYPARIATLSQVSSLTYCFPIEDLVDEFLQLRIEAERRGTSLSANPLYNAHIDDHHFSPRGTAVWGRALGRRIASLLELRRGRGQTKF